MRSGVWVNVAKFLQGRVEMATNDIGRRDGLAVSGAKQIPLFAFADVALQEVGNHRMKVNLPLGARRFEP